MTLLNTASVSADSRFKDTAQFVGPRGIQYALLEYPAEFAVLQATDCRLYTVVSADVGFIDRIMWLNYGIGFEKLWWVIAMVNGIIDAEQDMPVGTVLLLPSSTIIAQFRKRRGMTQ